MTVCGRIDVVDRFTNALKRSGRADSQVRHGHVVVNRTNEADEPEMHMRLELGFGDLV